MIDDSAVKQQVTFADTAQGEFLFENADFCSYVLKRGSRRNEMCGKPAEESFLLRRMVPACLRHLGKYDEKEILKGGILSTERISVTRNSHVAGMYEEWAVTPAPPKKSKKAKYVFELSSIPKAIDRTKECVVCLQEENPLLLPCGHTVCFQCAPQLKKDSCPFCRDPFKKNQLRRL